MPTIVLLVFLALLAYTIRRVGERSTSCGVTFGLLAIGIAGFAVFVWFLVVTGRIIW